MTTDMVEGYALRRNNTCGDTEKKCTPNATWDDWQACCPGNSFCFDSQASQANFICCEDTLNCTASIATEPTCADKSWNLFNSTGYFCCEEDQSAFNVDGTVWVGCADPGFSGGSKYIALDPSSVGTPVASSTATSSSTSSASSLASTTASTPSSTTGSNKSTESSHTNTGAIAGGVVGGVVGVAAISALLFFLLRSRNRKQPQQQTQYHDTQSVFSNGTQPGKGMHARELDGQASKSELAAGDDAFHERHELPSYN
ncbi:uncharacterized protein N7511_004691 [Penicillium nucicola]|uniref:uncharacterized protein n=1 Tax=Penicillium nucicola TaxID=1850975 RepID=UPI0025458346|nr:uncharacterized protein N7511_004691 [Penicillium nucicola]KAJ5767075.1 hypothetical protein N7511_004691 [Penicillium nucicola]